MFFLEIPANQLSLRMNILQQKQAFFFYVDGRLYTFTTSTFTTPSASFSRPRVGERILVFEEQEQFKNIYFKHLPSTTQDLKNKKRVNWHMCFDKYLKKASLQLVCVR